MLGGAVEDVDVHVGFCSGSRAVSFTGVQSISLYFYHRPTSLSFDGSGKRFALGQGEGRDGTNLTADVARTSTVVWDFEEGELIASGAGTVDIESVAMSNDGNYVYFTTQNTVKKTGHR